MRCVLKLNISASVESLGMKTYEASQLQLVNIFVYLSTGFVYRMP